VSHKLWKSPKSNHDPDLEELCLYTAEVTDYVLQRVDAFAVAARGNHVVKTIFIRGEETEFESPLLWTMFARAIGNFQSLRAFGTYDATRIATVQEVLRYTSIHSLTLDLGLQRIDTAAFTATLGGNQALTCVKLSDCHPFDLEQMD